MSSGRDEPRLFPFPSGWYCVADARAILPGELKRFELAGEEFVYFRTERGELGAMQAHCPHMGAHFGYGGRVRGENIQCPLHGFEFARSGDCVAVPESDACPDLRAQALPTTTAMDHLLVWYDYLGRAPAWLVRSFEHPRVPSLTDSFIVRTHPQEIAESGADWRHFRFLRRGDLRLKRCEPDVERPHVFLVKYAGKLFAESRVRPPIRDLWGDLWMASIDIELHGMGFLSARCDLHKLGIVIQYYACPTPLDETRTRLTIISAVEEIEDVATIAPILRHAPGYPWIRDALRRPLARLFTRLMFRNLVRMHREDVEVWQHKIHRTPRSGLDATMVRFREWCAQFYPQRNPYYSLAAANRARGLARLTDTVRSLADLSSRTVETIAISSTTVSAL